MVKFSRKQIAGNLDVEALLLQPAMYCIKICEGASLTAACRAGVRVYGQFMHSSNGNMCDIISLTCSTNQPDNNVGRTLQSLNNLPFEF